MIKSKRIGFFWKEEGLW